MILLAVLFFPACRSLLPAPPAERPEAARQQMLELNGIYRPVVSFKGIGHIRMWNDEGSFSARMAFAGTADGRIRVEILGLTGQPVATLIYDGKRYFFVSHTDRQMFEKSASGSAIKRLIGIEITTDELTTLLAGGLPVREHDVIGLVPETGDGTVLELKNGWWARTVEKLVINPETGRVDRIEIYGWNSLQYRVEYQEQRVMDGFLIPFRFTLSDDSNNGMSIRMDRYWPNASIKPGLFTHEGLR